MASTEIYRPASEPTPLPAFGYTLALDEFRLITLPAVSDKMAPMHITMETFTYENCPDYETLSYT